MKFTPAELCQVKRVYFHGSCPDGTASAMIVANAFERSGIKADFSPVMHNTAEHQEIVPQPGCLFVDITPHEGQEDVWLPHSPIVLDHHVTAEPTTVALGGVYGTNDAHCGAVLAYENVYVPLLGQNLEWREFARLAMVRDTWKRDSDSWQDACAQACALTFFGSKELVEKARRGEVVFREILDFGRVMRSKEERKAERYAETAYTTHMWLRGEQVKLGLFNCTDKLQSDTGNLLLEQGCDLAVGVFFTMEDGELTHCVSLRSAGRVSAGKIAKEMGGGGHDRAAGFQILDSKAAGPLQVLKAIQLAIYRVTPA